jgi:protocatechuate 4,5-dioxygenase beta chain
MSHAPPVHQHREATGRWLEKTLTKQRDNDCVIPAATWQLTPERLDGYWVRTRQSFDVLREKLRAYDPEVIVLFGGGGANQCPTETPSMVTVFTGTEAYGLISGDASGLSGDALAGKTPTEADYVRHKTDVALAEKIVNGLAARGIDVQASEVFKPNGPALLQDDWANPTEVFPRKDVSTVIVSMRYQGMEDGRDPSMHISGEFCYDLGRYVAQILEDDPRRIAVCGSGGLSHDPNGPRNMWIDTTLDHWVLDQIRESNGIALGNLFSFDSMTYRAGTREIAAWVAATGAMEYVGSKATIVDYIGDAPQLQGGIGYAYWERQPAPVPAAG